MAKTQRGQVDLRPLAQSTPNGMTSYSVVYRALPEHHVATLARQNPNAYTSLALSGDSSIRARGAAR